MLISILGKETFNPSKWHQQFKVGLGLDLSNGTQVVLKAVTPNGQPPSSGSMQQAISVLESRVNGTGNSGAQVQQQGSDLINVTVPGKAAQDGIDLVSATAKLNFRAVLLEQPYSGPPASRAAAHPGGSPTATPKASTSAKATATPKAGTTPAASPSPTSTAPAAATTFGDPSKVNAETKKLFDKLVCKPGPNANTVDDSWKATVGYTLGQAQWDDINSQIVSCDANGTKYVLDKAVFEGTDVTSVNTGLLQNSTQWVVNLTLNDKATKAFGTLTTNQYNNYFAGASTNQNDAVLDSTAVVLDGNVQSAPQTQQPITAGQVQISGPQPNGFSQAEATNLANILKYGALQ